MPAESRSERTSPSSPLFSGESDGASPPYVCPHGSADAPLLDGSQANSQFLLMSRPTQVEFAGPGWRFLRHRRLVVWVYTNPAAF